LRINLLPAHCSTKASVKPSKRKSTDATAFHTKNIVNQPPEAQHLEKKRSNALIYICWGILLLGSLIFLMAEYSVYDPAIGELISLKEQVNQYREDLDKKQQTLKNASKTDNRTPELAWIAHLYRPWLAIINGLSAALPEEVWLTGVEGGNEGGITVKCRSLTVTAAQDFIRNLEGSPLFSNAQLQEMRQVTPGVPDYTFTLMIETGGAKNDASEK